MKQLRIPVRANSWTYSCKKPWPAWPCRVPQTIDFRTNFNGRQQQDSRQHKAEGFLSLENIEDFDRSLLITKRRFLTLPLPFIRETAGTKLKKTCRSCDQHGKKNQKMKSIRLYDLCASSALHRFRAAATSKQQPQPLTVREWSKTWCLHSFHRR